MEALVLRHLGSRPPPAARGAGSLSSPRVSWHRGGGETTPSASRAAFIDAATAGAECIEVDVRRSADGVLVCVHDPVIEGLGPVCDLSVGTLADADRGRVLAFTTFLDDLDGADPARRSVVHLDLKGRGYEVDAVDAVRAHERPLFVTTSERDSVATVRRDRPAVPAYLTIGRSSQGLSVRATLALRLAELVPLRAITRSGATGIAAHHALLTAPLRWWCRRRGLAMVVWTVDDDAGLRTWLSRRVDVVTTNRPRAALALRDG